MGSILVFALILGFAPAPPTPREALAESRAVAARLTTRTERTVAFLAIARAQDRLGERANALKSLQTGWEAYEKGSDKGMSEGDVTDSHTLFDTGDFSMLPIHYAYEFVVAGDPTAARRAALSLGLSDLADAYRQGLHDQLRKKYPEVADAVTLTDAQLTRQKARKAELLASLAAIRAEPDFGKRSFELYEIADELTRAGGTAEALPLFREAATASQGIEEPGWRAADQAQIADRLWLLGAKGEARTLLAQAEKALPEVEEGEKRNRARFFVEQTKETMGLPNDKMGALRGTGPVPAVAPSGEAPGISPGGPKSISSWQLLAKAEEQRAKGDLAGAQRTLRTIRARADGDGPLHQSIGELQARLGDRAAARANLAIAGRVLMGSLQASPVSDNGSVQALENLAALQIANSDRSAALATLSQGLKRLIGTERWATVTHFVNGKTRLVKHDRRSPMQHAGAMALARTGFFAQAVAMARTIQSPGHRAITLANIVSETVSGQPAKRGSGTRSLSGSRNSDHAAVDFRRGYSTDFQL